LRALLDAWSNDRTRLELVRAHFPSRGDARARRRWFTDRFAIHAHVPDRFVDVSFATHRRISKNLARISKFPLARVVIAK
jgi:hypothetical protein